MGVGPLHTIGEVAEGQRGDGEKGAAGKDHNGAGEGPDTALATLAAEPPACERGGQTLWPGTVYGTAASRRRRRARTSVLAAKTNSQSRSRSGEGGCVRADASEQPPASTRARPQWTVLAKASTPRIHPEKRRRPSVSRHSRARRQDCPRRGGVTAAGS